LKVGIQGKGSEIKWVDEQDLPVTKEFVKFKKETTELINSLVSELKETKQELKKTKLENVEVIRKVISR
jgi:tmRNA-binding protein